MGNIVVVGGGIGGLAAAIACTRAGWQVDLLEQAKAFGEVGAGLQLGPNATRILREIKLLRLLRHPDIVEIKHIMLPPSQRDFKDIYVVFELMETDLHQVRPPAAVLMLLVA